MVRGLFPRAERDAVLATLERSVVFITTANMERLLRGCNFDSSAWTLANLFLASVGAELLAKDAPRLVGLSEEMTCYVSPEYFLEDDPFADFVIHEAAHVFHNCKRGTIGLRETRAKQCLLDIDYRKRETFAYACEAYACIFERGKRRPSDWRWQKRTAARGDSLTSASMALGQSEANSPPRQRPENQGSKSTFSGVLRSGPSIRAGLEAGSVGN